MRSGTASPPVRPTVLPAWASLGGAGATILIGGLAGLYPAVRAAGLTPAEAPSAN